MMPADGAASLIPESSRWIDTAALPWQAAGTNGLMSKSLHVSTRDSLYVGLTRFPPGGEIPLHRHDGDEFLYVLEGTLDDDGGHHPAGCASYRPPGCTHAVSSRQGAIVFVFFTGRSVPAATGSAGPPSRPIRPDEFSASVAADASTTRTLLWQDGPSARRAELMHMPAGSYPHLSGQGYDRACFIVDGMAESAEGILGPGGFCYVPDGQSTSARVMDAAVLLVIEWLPADAFTGKPG